MRTLKHLIVVLTLALFAGVSLTAQAQEQDVIKGQLVRLDPAAKKIVIKTERGSQMQFEYTDDTVVNGADQTVAGLGTRTGTSVTVQYEKQETRMLAIQIDVHRK